MARGKMVIVERRAEARGHSVVWDYVEDTRACATCTVCGTTVRIIRPYGGDVTIEGDMLDRDCISAAPRSRDA